MMVNKQRSLYGQFLNWWRTSKYTQVVQSAGHEEQLAWDAFQASHEMMQKYIQDAERYRFLREGAVALGDPATFATPDLYSDNGCNRILGRRSKNLASYPRGFSMTNSAYVIETAHAVYETIDEYGHKGAREGIYRFKANADEASQGVGWWGGRGMVEECYVLNVDGKAFLLAQKDPVVLDFGLQKARELKTRMDALAEAALASLSETEREAVKKYLLESSRKVK